MIFACPSFQQPMRPVTSSFHSIADLAHVRSKSPKDMSHAACLTLRLNASIRGPTHTATLGSSQVEQAK
ncbi:hypothetical protein FF2_027283 [Malus domestica]